MSRSTTPYPYLSATTYILLIATICSIHGICPTLALSSTTTTTSASARASASARSQKIIIPRDDLLKELTKDGLMILTKMGNDSNNNDSEDAGILIKTGSLADIIGRLDVFGGIGGGFHDKHNDIDNSENEGHSIAVSSDGDTIAVGVSRSSDNKRGSPHHHHHHYRHHCYNRRYHNSDFVRVFRKKKGGKWIQRGQDIVNLGHIVSLSNNGRILAIGKSNDFETLVGESTDAEYVNDNNTIRIFKFKARLNEWSEMGIIESASDSSPSSFFGTSSSLPGHGRLLAIGASGHDGFNITVKGSVRVYHRSFQNKTQSGRDIYL